MLLRENSTPLTAASPQPVGDGPAPGEHSSSPREFLRRSAGGMIRVANPLRQSLGRLGPQINPTGGGSKIQMNPMNDADASDDASDDLHMSCALRRRSDSGGLRFVRRVRSGEPMTHAQREAVSRADAGEFENLRMTSQAAEPVEICIQRDPFENSLAAFDEWLFRSGLLGSGCSEQCGELRRAAGVLKPRTISMLECEAAASDAFAACTGEWHCLPTTDVMTSIDLRVPGLLRDRAALKPFRTSALRDAVHKARLSLNQENAFPDTREEYLDKLRVLAERTECLEAVNATPPWLRAVVRAEQHLAWARIALPDQPARQQQQLPWDVILRVGQLLPREQPVQFLPHLLAPHTVTWRSERWLELCTERQDAEDTIISMAPGLRRQIAAAKKRRKREEDTDAVGKCCTCCALSVFLYAAAALGLCVVFWFYFWALKKVVANEELCECEMDDSGSDLPLYRIGANSGLAAGAGASPVTSCCSVATRKACATMRSHAILVFCCVITLTLLKVFTMITCNVMAAVTDADHERADRRAERWNKCWSSFGCVQLYAIWSLWHDLYVDTTDDCTDELIDGTRILVFGPMWLALAVCCCICFVSGLQLVADGR
jgi:hypothetical protein